MTKNRIDDMVVDCGRLLLKEFEETVPQGCSIWSLDTDELLVWMDACDVAFGLIKAHPPLG